MQSVVGGWQPLTWHVMCLILQECKHEVVVSLLTLLNERDKATWCNDQVCVAEVVHDLIKIFPPHIDPTAQDSLYVHLYVRWRLPQACDALNFEMHVYAANAVVGIDIVYWRLFSVFIGFHGSLRDEGVLFSVFLHYHYARYIEHVPCSYVLLLCSPCVTYAVGKSMQNTTGTSQRGTGMMGI
jgi:hypothetical protein